MTELVISGAVQARHNWNDWKAECPACPSAMTIPVGTTTVTCWDCGAVIGPIVWPNDPAGIEAILSYRPDPNTRNWDPGQTLEELLLENAEAGDVPPEWRALDSGTVVIDIVDGFVVGGLVMERRALLAGSRPQHVIGA